MLLRLLAAAGLVAVLAPAALADGKLVQKVYSVADLVIPIPEPTTTDARPGAPAAPATSEAALLKLIRTVVYPSTWQEAGGMGFIDYYPIGMSLVVQQSAEAHEKIAQLLESLRRLQDKQVVFEVRFVQVSESAFENISAGLDARPADGPVPAARLPFRQDGSLLEQLAAARWHPQHAVLLNDVQVYRLLEAVQADRTANVMQMPRLTTFEGQRAAVRTGETRFFFTGMQEKAVNDRVVQVPVQTPEFIGTQLAVQGAATPDRKHVCVHVRGVLSAVDPMAPCVTPVFEGGAQGPPIPCTQFLQPPTGTSLNVQTTTVVPAGGTVMIGGLKTLSGNKTVCEGRNESVSPVPSNVPYVNQLFKNVGPACDEPAAPCARCIPNLQIERLAVEKTLAIPDGGTALIDCGKFMVIDRIECGSPALSKVPYVNRLFKNVGYGREERRVLMLVTAQLMRGAEACQAGAIGSGTGKLLVGTGVNSDAGLCGSVVLNERNFECSAAGGCCVKNADAEPAGCCKGSFSLAEVVQLAAAKVSDEIIINQILTTGTCYTLDARAILWLKAHGVSDAVVMQMQGTRPKAEAPAASTVGLTGSLAPAPCPEAAAASSVSDAIVGGLLQMAEFCAPTLGLFPPGVLVNVYSSDPNGLRMPMSVDWAYPTPAKMER